MKTPRSSKEQIPGARQVSLRSTVLTSGRNAAAKSAIIRDSGTGFPVITAGRGAPALTDEQVHEILAEFP
jgi:hypothetical protein